MKGITEIIHPAGPVAYKRKRQLTAVGHTLFSLFRLIVLLAIGFVVLYPFLYMIVTSLRTRESFMNSARVWIPEAIDPVKNYRIAARVLRYGSSLLSTLSLEMVSALIEVISCAVAAYGFARFRFPLRRVMLAMLFLTILVPDTMIIIPRVTNYANMDIFGVFGLINQLTGVDLRVNILGSPLAFWLPSLFGAGLRSGILIFIYIQFFKGFQRSWRKPLGSMGRSDSHLCTHCPSLVRRSYPDRFRVFRNLALE